MKKLDAAAMITKTGRANKRTSPIRRADGRWLAWADRRAVVSLPPPVECPNCGSTKTTTEGGVHYRRGLRIENRVCSACGFAFIGCRGMTSAERAAH